MTLTPLAIFQAAKLNCHSIMLHKFFGVQRLKPSWRRQVPPTSAPAVEERPLALKIIHAGGNVESYYMAVPATSIMEKYPSSVLARPDVFRRPWDAVVRPEEILVPGQKFFIVPRRTLKKLRQRMHKPPGGEQSITNSSVSESFSDVSAEIIVSRKKNDFFSSNSFSQKSYVSISSIVTYKNKGKTRARNCRVRFDAKQDSETFATENKGNAEDNPKKSLDNPRPGRRGKRRVRNPVTWHPTLTAITEIDGSNE